MTSLRPFRIVHAVRLPVRRSVAFTLIELLIVVGLIALLISVLLPTISRVREHAKRAMLDAESRSPAPASVQAAIDAVQSQSSASAATDPGRTRPAPQRPLAIIKSFDADVTLTPQLSIGTAERESIYESKFVVKMDAIAGGAGENEIHLPLPPQIISLNDLSVSVAGQPSEAVALHGDQLIWSGALAGSGADEKQPTPTPITTPIVITYTAVGRGIYALQTPPAKILDQFKIQLTANGSDVRMLELSMQPTSLVHRGNATIYTWDYKRLMFGRPITIDVLGIAPIDRLGELSWLGPLSVIVFGLVLGLISRAYDVANVDRWMLLMMIGTFTGAYPLMYFAQEFVPLNTAIIASAAIVLLIIGLRAIRSMGFVLGVGGVFMPAAATMGLALTAVVRPNLQGILLTTMALGLFMAAMTLAPRLRMAPARREGEEVQQLPPSAPAVS